MKTLSETKELKEIKNLKMKLTEAEDVNPRLQHECEEAVNDSEECHKKIEVLETKLSNCKDDKAKLECELEVAGKKWKGLAKLLKKRTKQFMISKRKIMLFQTIFLKLNPSFQPYQLQSTEREKRKKRS